MRYFLLLSVILTGMSAASCPLGYPPEQACPESSPSCALFTDVDEDRLCNNPGSQPSAEPVEVVPETPQDELPAEEPVAEFEEFLPEPDEPLAEEPITEFEEVLPEPEEPGREVWPDELVACPLGYTPEQACATENPGCTLFRDPDSSDICDNPLLVVARDTVPAVQEQPVAEETETVEPVAGKTYGCPYYLSPSTACPESLALCPHWSGLARKSACSNPAGGKRRLFIALVSIFVLLVVSTVISRSIKGRRLMDRIERERAHMVVRGVSMMVLGFGIQGCFCPLGAFQYLFLKNGLQFLGWMGTAILVLPMIFSLFFGRTYCGWVCPIGGLQEFLFRIRVPGQFSPGEKSYHILKWTKYIILVGLVAYLVLARNSQTGHWPALFCAIDPFHTIFTLFLSGSLIIAGITILLSIFIRRFFCRYLCFYGALLSILSRACLFTRIRKHALRLGIGERPEEDSDREFDQ